MSSPFANLSAEDMLSLLVQYPDFCEWTMDDVHEKQELEQALAASTQQATDIPATQAPPMEETTVHSDFLVHVEEEVEVVMVQSSPAKRPPSPANSNLESPTKMAKHKVADHCGSGPAKLASPPKMAPLSARKPQLPKKPEAPLGHLTLKLQHRPNFNFGQSTTAGPSNNSKASGYSQEGI